MGTQIQELENKILKNNKLYEEGTPEITDSEYDFLVETLKYLSPESDVLKQVGAPVSYGKNVKHDIPMGSLDKIKCRVDKNGEPEDGHGSQDLEEWVRKIDEVVCFSPKVDGLAGELVYNNGKLIQASSRGDGAVGKNITDNVMCISTIPNEIEPKSKIVIRGEFYIPRSTFERLIKDKAIKGDVVNERNVCAGAINSKNPHDTASKGICFLAYRLWIDDIECKDIVDAFNIVNSIKGYHFGRGPVRIKYVDQIVCGYPKDVKDIVKYMSEKRSELDYRTDGIVVMVKDRDKRESFGYSGYNPKGAVAFKFQTQQAVTRLEGIDWVTSKFGTINPIAKLAPVVLCDTVVRAATLHNINWIESLSLSIGDDVVIEKSGDIIPHVVRAIHNKATENINYPNLCPSCGHGTIRDGAQIICINQHCKAIVAGTILNYLQALGISEPGKVMIENMVESGIVKGIEDIYHLDVDKIKNLPRCSEMLAKRYVENINSIKSVDIVKFMCAMPIRNIGEATWKSVCNVYPTIESIMSADWDKLTTIPNIGIETANTIIKGISGCARLIESLKKNITIEPLPTFTGKFSGKSFCFTGKMKHVRKYYEDIVNLNGGQIKGVVKSLDYLVAGEDAGSKLSRANLLGVKVINENEFLRMAYK